MRAWLLCATALTGLALTRPAPAQPAPGTGPQGGRVVAGQAAITTAPGRTTITQGSERAAIDWQRFDVGRDHTVQFRQPSAQSWTLNRVQAGDPSTIAGRIQANGGVVITNPSGVVFSQGAQVNVGSLIASAPGITNEAFMAGRMRFDQPARPGARVSNAGEITVAQGGLAALVAPEVANSGRIRARLGRVVMGGAEAYALDLQGDGLISFDVTEQVRSRGGAPALVTNSGEIEAQGGTVLLAARAAGGVIETLVSQAGTIEVGPGRATLRAEGGDVAVSGRIGAQGGPAARGGTVAVVASGTARLAPTARIDASGGAGGGRVVVGAGAESRPGAAVGLGGGVAMAEGARIRADATQRGAGGTVVLHSANRTEARGAISARGAGGGDGGEVEVSSHGLLLMGAVVDLVAPGGRPGRLLVDPAVVHVVDSFTGGPTSEVLASTIATTAGDYRLEAQQAIRVLAPIDKASGGLVLATTGADLLDGGGIFVDAAITLRDPAAGFGVTTPGLFALRGGAAISAPSISLLAGGMAVTGELIGTAISLNANGAAGDSRVLNGGISITGRISGNQIGLFSGFGFVHLGTAALTGDEIAAMPSAAGLVTADLLRGTPGLLRASLRTTGTDGAILIQAGREAYVSGQIAAGDSARSGAISITTGTDLTLAGNIDAYGSATRTTATVQLTASGTITHSGQTRVFHETGPAAPWGLSISAMGGFVNTGLLASRDATTSLAIADLPGVQVTTQGGPLRSGAIDSGGRLFLQGQGGVLVDGPITGALGPSAGGSVTLRSNLGGGDIHVDQPLTVPGGVGIFDAVADGAFHLSGFGDARGISANTIRISAGGIALAGSLSAGMDELGHNGGGEILVSTRLGGTALGGSLTLLNTIRAGVDTTVNLNTNQTNGFLLVASAAQATDLLASLGGPSRPEVLRGNACPGACARIDALGTGLLTLWSGAGSLVNAGSITGRGGVAIANGSGRVINTGLIAGSIDRSAAPAVTTGLSIVTAGEISNTGTLRGSGGARGSTILPFTPALSLVGGSVLQGVGGAIEARAGTAPVEGAGGLEIRVVGPGGSLTNRGLITAEGGVTLFAAGDIRNDATGIIRHSPTALSGTAADGLQLQAIGGFSNAGLIESSTLSPRDATAIFVDVGGAIRQTGSMATPSLLYLDAGLDVTLGGSLSAATLWVVGESISLDGAVMNLTGSGWFAAPQITAGAPSRLGYLGARPALIFDARAVRLPGAASPDLTGSDDDAQPLQLASFGAPGAGPGGAVTLDLDAGQAPVFLLLDDGVVSGRLGAGRLGVQGRGGAALLTGSLAGDAGTSAAVRAVLTPQADAAAQARYTLNGCVLALAGCAVAPPVLAGSAPAPEERPLAGPVPSPAILPLVGTATRLPSPALLLEGSLAEAEPGIAPQAGAPLPILPQPTLVSLRATRARLADPDLVLPLSLAEEE